jgi:hypothetical protein
MSCYDTLKADVTCSKCGYTFRDNGIQTQDFEGLCDSLTQGDDTRECAETYIIHCDSSIFRNNKIKTIEDAVNFQLKNPLKYRLNIFRHKDGSTSWHIYKFCGFQPTTFFNIKDKEFDCYTICKKCKAWLDLKGIIKDYVFVGVKNIESQNNSELVLEGDDAKKFVKRMSKPLSKKEKKDLDNAHKFYKKHTLWTQEDTNAVKHYLNRVKSGREKPVKLNEFENNNNS